MPRVVVADGGSAALDDACEGLTADGFKVEHVQGIPALLTAARGVPADVVVVGMGLPDGGAVAACRALREFTDAYVIVAAASPDEVSTVLVLSVGADEVVGIGTSGREMAARARAMLRRPRGVPEDAGPYEVGDLRIDPGERSAWVGAGPLDLTRTEFALLSALAQAFPSVVERSRLVERVWGPGRMPDDHTLDVHVSNIRRKLAAAGGQIGVVTRRGVGFRLFAEA